MIGLLATVYVGMAINLNCVSIREFVLCLYLRLAYFLRNKWNCQAQEKRENCRRPHCRSSVYDILITA